MSHLGHLEGKQPYLGDLLTMVINHLLTGMILQVPTWSLTRPLKSYPDPIGKENVFQPSVFRGDFLLVLGRVVDIYQWSFRCCKRRHIIVVIFIIIIILILVIIIIILVIIVIIIIIITISISIIIIIIIIILLEKTQCLSRPQWSCWSSSRLP